LFVKLDKQTKPLQIGPTIVVSITVGPNTDVKHGESMFSPFYNAQFYCIYMLLKGFFTDTALTNPALSGKVM